ncbi:exported hypothetical protein [Vibrio coralliirubri]|uniref:hypothetical protein n=1 Tax=Vibrio coralliirubri TaxID=1516159 RepID=UPI0006332A08|nr:hypothetical protein [Vibrio coralliirubri]CDU04663.1 exported hypothetical protein [Vibrio coralliirubri]
MKKALTCALTIVTLNVNAHTHDFAKREVQVYADKSSHSFILTNRNDLKANFSVTIDNIEVGIVENLDKDESVPITLELHVEPDSTESKRICTFMQSYTPHQTRVCSLIILSRL